MIFSIASIEEAKVAALAAENIGGNYVKTPGAYAGTIAAACFKKFKSGSGGLEIELTVPANDIDPERILKFMIITLTKAGVSTYTNDKGTFPLPGMNQITGGLLPIVKMREIPSVDDGKGGATYPTLLGKKIGVLIDIRKTNGSGKNANKVYDNPSIVGFYCPLTNKTGSEILNNTEALKKVKIQAGLKVVDDTTQVQAGASDASDPFGDANSAIEDPFSQGKEEETPSLPEAVKEEVKTETPVETTPATTTTPDAGAAADNFWG